MLWKVFCHTLIGTLFLVVLSASPVIAGTAKPSLASDRVCGIKVVSDKIEDVTTLDAVLGWMIKPGMSDKEKALAIWKMCVKFRQQDNPPNEWVEVDGQVHDPIKTFNVYGYGMCGCVTSNITGLGRAVGLQVRGRCITSHSVPEVYWDGTWHLLDASLINYMPNAKGDVASVDEIIASVDEWLKKNPDYRDNDAKLREFMRNGGWRKGPAVLAASTFYDENGWLPARTHGWYSTMQEYNGKNNGYYEYGYSMGYKALFALRPGEKLIRNWSNKGLHVNKDLGDTPGSLKDHVGQGDMAYAVKYGDLAPGRIGNGTLLYRVPLDKSTWKTGAWKLDNVKDGPGIVSMNKTKPAEVVFRMHCPYIFLGGKVRIAGEITGATPIQILISTNNGLDFTEFEKISDVGAFTKEIDTSKRIYRRYDYYIKFVLASGATIKGLEIENDIQHSQRSLPALAQGKNTVTVSSGPSIDTITVSPSLWKDVGTKAEALANFHPTITDIRHDGNEMWYSGAKAQLTIPVETPGDITAVRFGGHFRARGAKDGVNLLVSFDDGKTWLKAGEVPGPYAGYCKYVEFKDVPKGARKVLVGYKLVQGEVVAGIFSVRIDVDYWATNDGKETKSGSSQNLKVTYVYNDNGEKQQVLMTKKSVDTFTIDCSSKPLMKSIVVEQAP